MEEKILVVDDEADIRHLLGLTLESEGYTIITAENGQEALAQFTHHCPDLVVTDIKMPTQDGVALLKAIKASGSEVDIIMLTGHSDERTAIECLRHGAYDYLRKPLDEIEILLVSVERALQKRRLELQNDALLRQLEELAMTDPLTGLYNYRYLQKCLDTEIIRAQRFAHPFCFVMLDIDDFKRVNDTFGHVGGDAVLKALSDSIRATLRTCDSAYRYGGEELSILMPETSRDGALVAIERLMGVIRSQRVVYDRHTIQVTVSMGRAAYPAQAEEKTALIRCADQALYAAKRAGKNRWVFAGDTGIGSGIQEPPPAPPRRGRPLRGGRYSPPGRGRNE